MSINCDRRDLPNDRCGYCKDEEIDQLRAENEKLTKQVRSYAALVKSMEETKSILLRNTHNLAESVATLESEREANKMLTEELNEQARLLGISAEKELALLAKVEQLERELAKVKKDANRYRWLCNKVAVLNDGYTTLCVPCSGVDLTEEDKRDTDIAIDKAMEGK